MFHLASCVGTVPTYKCKLSCKILVSHNDYYDDYSEWDVMPCGLLDGVSGFVGPSASILRVKECRRDSVMLHTFLG